MAESREPGTLGSTPGTTGTATHSTDANSTNTDGIVGKVREQAKTQLSSQKDRATDGLGSVAQAVRQTTQQLRDNQNDTVARYAEQAADQIERFSERLRNKDVGELMNDAQQLARRQPAMFVGGAFALGLLGARFLKSSSPDSRDSYGSYGGERGYGSGYGNTGYGSTGYGNTGHGSAGTGSGFGNPGSSNYGTGYSGSATSGTGRSTSSGVGGGSAAGTTGLSGTGSTTGQGTTSRGRGENAYGNRVPGTARKASTSGNKRSDNTPDEGL